MLQKRTEMKKENITKINIKNTTLDLKIKFILIYIYIPYSFDPILFFKQVKLKKSSNSTDIRQG